MCAYQSAKSSFTRDEIVDILKKNIDLYKNDPNFTNYLVDLALYLIEYAYQKEIDTPHFREENLDIVTLGAQKLYKVFRDPTSLDSTKVCPFCGAPNRGTTGRCAQCGQVI